MEKQTHRAPTLYIVGNKERKEEIRHIIVDEWGGNGSNFEYYDTNIAYYVDPFGCVHNVSVNSALLKNAVRTGWMKEYKLPEKPQFKPFDKVVARCDKGCIWFASLYSHYDESDHHVLINTLSYRYCLPYNEDTAKLIGTSDEWKGGMNNGQC